MSQEQNFKLNTSNYIGFEYKKYLNEMKGMALTDPKKYATLRNEAVNKLADNLSKQWYEITYDILTNGQTDNAKDSINLGLPAKPSYPAQELAKLALSHTQTIVDMMDEIVELLVPENYLSTAMSQLEAKRSTNGINV
jgi:hypothetical protein